MLNSSQNFNVRDQGIVLADGIVDNTAAFLATASDAIATGLPISIYVPAGRYRMTQLWNFILKSQTQGVTLYGDGEASSIIIWDGGDGVSFCPAAPQQLGVNNQCQVVVRGVTFATKGPGDGTAIKFDWSISDRFQPGNKVQSCTFDQYLVSNPPLVTGFWRTCIEFSNCINAWVTDCNAVGSIVAGTSGVLVSYPVAMPTDANLIPCDLRISRSMFTNFDTCINLGTCEGGGIQGVYIDHVDMLGNTGIFYCATTGSFSAEEVIIDHCYFDVHTAAISMTNMARIWCSDSMFDAYPTATDVFLRGSEQVFFHHNLHDGGDGDPCGTALDIDTSTRVKIDHCEFFNKVTDAILGPGTYCCNIIENDYTIDDPLGKASRPARITDQGNGNIVGTSRNFTATILLKGGAPTETHYLDTTICGFARKPDGSQVQISNDKTVDTVYQWDQLCVANSLVVGQDYTIADVGTTDFTKVGASSNTVGVEFRATGSGIGTGYASGNTTTRIAVLFFNRGATAANPGPPLPSEYVRVSVQAGPGQTVGFVG